MPRVRVYTVYDNKTDFPVCVCESAKRCAEIMGIKLNTFHRLVGNSKKFGKRWTILRMGVEEYESNS